MKGNQLTLTTRVGIINGVAIALIVIMGGVIYWHFEQAFQITRSLGVSQAALKNQAQSDLARVALRSDLLMALAADLRKDVSKKDHVLKDIEVHASIFRESVDRSRNMELSLDIRRVLDNLVQPVDGYVRRVRELVELAVQDPVAVQKEMSQFDEEYRGLGARILELNQKIEDQMQGAQSENSLLGTSSLIFIISIIIVAAVVMFVISYLFLKSVTSPLQHVISSLSEGAEQFSASARLVSSAGQHLAMGSSQQAASLEEASASLEQISGMTKHNAENAQKTSVLVADTRSSMEENMVDMGQLVSAMDAIKTSSDSISKIIKTIDEISFQTNILALNAAVEAARAGEAGMGFAVVADEVRSLAQNSAKAARDTAEKIEDSIQKTEQAFRASSKVAGKLTEVMNHIRKVDDLVAEISSASREQSLGIEQINLAVNQIDEGTQSTAANAEESASAAEQLNAQAAELEGAVRELVELIGKQNLEPTPAGRHPERASLRDSTIMSHYPGMTPGNRKEGKRMEAGRSKLLGKQEGRKKSDGDIPMDPHFKDF